jgi:hypothetical protein
VNRERLFDLTERVKLVAGVELPVIVGSQSLYGVTPHVPDIVKRSVECDFLLLAAGPPAFRAVIEQIQQLPGDTRVLRGCGRPRHRRAADGVAGAARAFDGRGRNLARLLS